jgi:hypothetical protein
MGWLRGVATLVARATKVIIPLDPVAVRDALAPLKKSEARIPFAIAVGGHTLKTDFSHMSARRAFAILDELGPDKVAVLIQGKVLADDVIGEAGCWCIPA